MKQKQKIPNPIINKFRLLNKKCIFCNGDFKLMSCSRVTSRLKKIYKYLASYKCSACGRGLGHFIKR